jgi:hypothetical protein
LLGQPEIAGPRDGDFLERRLDLDPLDQAAERACEHERRAAPARRDVEDAGLRAETEPLPEQDDLLLGGRVLELV